MTMLIEELFLAVHKGPSVQIAFNMPMSSASPFRIAAPPRTQ
jgi:hypothetical protein